MVVYTPNNELPNGWILTKVRKMMSEASCDSHEKWKPDAITAVITL